MTPNLRPLALVPCLFLSTTLLADDFRTRADRSFASHEIREAVELYERAADTAEGRERASARLRQAHLEWRFLGDFAKARSTLEGTLEETGQLTPDLYLELAELERAAGAWTDAREAASRALVRATSAHEENEARVAWAEAVLEDPELAKSGSATRALNDATAVLETLVEEEPGDLETSRLLLRAALRVGDGDAALRAWRSYYRVPPGGRPYALLRPAWEVLEERLPSWRGEVAAEVLVPLVRALADSGFHAAARELALRTEAASPARAELASTLAYAELVEVLRERTEDYYRRLALGETEGTELGYLLVEEIGERWQALGLDGPAPRLPPGLGAEELMSHLIELQLRVVPPFADRFGVFVGAGPTAGYFDLHMGHEVLDEEHAFEQYGHEAAIRFVLLDHMVSNGFQSWAWSHRSQHGGWARPDAIYQVRPAYADGPADDWRRLTDPHERAEWGEEIARETKADAVRAEGDPYAYLPGLEDRLELAALERLRDRLVAEGYEGSELRTAFLQELERIQQEYSIFHHEGRHVIDKRLGIEGSEELEYRAKLSEVALAELPELALAGPVLDPNLGDPTPHGQANLRVVKGLVAWMYEHRNEIAGLDEDRPLLPQADRLTPEQLRAAIRSLDPLAAPDPTRAEADSR